MSKEVSVPPLGQPVQLDASSFASSSSSSSSLWDRISTWASENKAVVYTIAGVTLVVTAAGIYYVNSSQAAESEKATTPSSKKKTRKRKGKKSDVEASAGTEKSESKPQSASVISGDLPVDVDELTEEVIASLSEQERKDQASKVKAAGNKAYGSKDYNKAIDLYTKAIALKQDPIFYSNRAACHQAMGDWESVVDDTTAAVNLDPMYVKALNRRANAYEQLKRFQEALLDYTASCIIDKFQNPTSANKVESLLQIVATNKAAEVFSDKNRRLPSAAFISNYLQSFRPKPIPAGLEDAKAIEEEAGKLELRTGLVALQGRSAADYNEASAAFTKALELGGLDEYEALAYNMRATFRWLMGDIEAAMKDINHSIEIDPTFTQSYVKRVSMHLESGMYIS
jgi:import receptor subunit TOM70